VNEVFILSSKQYDKDIAGEGDSDFIRMRKLKTLSLPSWYASQGPKLSAVHQIMLLIESERQRGRR
jgi:hypothetical protein